MAQEGIHVGRVKHLNLLLLKKESRPSVTLKAEPREREAASSQSCAEMTC